MSVPGRVAVDALAAPDAGRLGAIPGLRQGEVRDSPWASGRDFPSAMRGKERLVLPQPQNERQQRRAQLPKAGCRLALLASQVLLVESVYPAAPWQALLASQLAHADESALPQALLALQASHLVALVHALAPFVPREQPPRAPPVQLALPPQRLELPARSVSLPLAPRLLPESPRARQSSAARLF